MSSFKNWLFEEEDVESKIESMIDSEGFILFFKKDDECFGVNEDGRVVFAKMKSPDDDLPSGWEDEASFSAQNLNKKIKGEPGTTHLFKKSDLKKIKVMDRKEMSKELKKIAEDLGDEAFKKEQGSSFKVLDIAKLFQKEPDEAPNFIRADEE